MSQPAPNPLQEEITLRHNRMAGNIAKVFQQLGLKPGPQTVALVDALSFAVAVEITDALSTKQDKPKIEIAATLPPVKVTP